ncbi:MAG: glycosyltransferase [Candidatus Accumulibacter sp.]|nr:glycosyltransferase [Accumulibacter sp.]
MLRQCLSKITEQTRPPDQILVVDNASTDGTTAWISEWAAKSPVKARAITLAENTGGSGGFSEGLRIAIADGADWVWMMDDDAEPHPDALEHLLDRSLEPENLYGSAAISGEKLSWPMMAMEAAIHETRQLSGEVDVQFIPFLGLLVSSRLINKIGLPDAGFFLAADDVDYCMRARQAGAKILLVGASRIEHPASERYRLWLPGRKFYSLKLPPWKRYYDVRNRIFVARNHYGLALYYKTIPGSFLRLFATLIHEPRRLAQLWAFIAGLVDGLLGRKGRRHTNWKIN